MRFYNPKAVSLILMTTCAASVGAQTVPNPGALRQVRYDSGFATTSWKVGTPSGALDYFSVDLDGDAAGLCCVAILAQTYEPFPGGAIGKLGVYPDSALDPTGHTPDLALPIVETAMNPAGLPGGFCEGDVAYDVADTTIPSGGFHVAFMMNPGDASVWLCAESTGPLAGRSFLSADGYATPAVPMTGPTAANLILGIGADPCAKEGTLWVNGAVSTAIDELDELYLLFQGGRSLQPYMLFLSSGGAPLAPAVNLVFLTGSGAVDDAGFTGSLRTTWPCATFTGTLNLMAVYFDSVTTKVSLSNEVTVTVDASAAACQPTGCDWGQKDDGIFDFAIWKIQNPAGSLDYFSLAAGSPTAAVTSITGIEAASWDFCGNGPSWADVGIYSSDLHMDPTGGTPNFLDPISVTTTNTSMAPGASDWSYPATFYDLGDVPANPAIEYHAALHYPTNDTCIWIASDTDGTDDAQCGTIPATCSFFTADGFATPAVPITTANWMMRITWD